MHKLLFGVAFSFICNSGFSQRLSKRVLSPIDSSANAYIPRIPTIDAEIKRFDSVKMENFKNYEVFRLSVFNNTDSTICILFSSELGESIKHQVFGLDPVYDCSNDTLKYYSLEHCSNWDMGNLPLPAKPILVSPNTYLNTIFSIEAKPDRPNQFHLHYASVDMTYNDIMKAYKSDIHNWEHSLPIKCKRILLPN